MSKTIIIPIVAVIALVVKGMFNVEIDQPTQDMIVEIASGIVVGVVALIGIFKNYKKKVEEKK